MRINFHEGYKASGLHTFVAFINVLKARA